MPLLLFFRMSPMMGACSSCKDFNKRERKPRDDFWPKQKTGSS